MEEFETTEQIRKKITEINTFPVPFTFLEIKEDITINTNTLYQGSKEKIIDQAIKFHSQGNISEAKKYYQYFINQGFKDHRVFSNYGTILKNDGKLKEAELSTRKAIKLNPDFAISHSNLGLILKDLGKLKEAEISIRKAIRLKPDFANAHSNLGLILKDLGQLKEAELSTRKAIEINPDFAEAYNNLGNILIEFSSQSEDKDILKKSIVQFKKAIKLNPSFTNSYLGIGEVLKGEPNREREAEEYILKAIKLDPYEEKSYTLLGEIYNKLGKKVEAENLLRRAIKLNPKLELAHFNLGINYLMRNNLDSAIESFKTAKSLKPDRKYTQILINFAETRYNKIIDSSGLQFINTKDKDQGLENNPLILNREVENELLNSIYQIKNITHVRGGDPSFGDIGGSTYHFLDNEVPIIKLLEKDLVSLLKDNLERNIYIHESFSTILGKSGGGLNKHNHIGYLDRLKDIELSNKKFSLIYYLSVGDQNCSEPGYLKLYEPEKTILPYEGMIITFPANRYHSVMYNGTKVRVAIVVNYYAI